MTLIKLKKTLTIWRRFQVYYDVPTSEIQGNVTFSLVPISIIRQNSTAWHNCSSLKEHPKYAIEMTDSLITSRRHTRSSYIDSGEGTVRQRVRADLTFPAINIKHIRYAWYTYASGDADNIAKREFMRVYYADGTYTNVHGGYNRSSCCATRVSAASGDWQNVTGISVQLYANSKEENRAYSSSSASARIGFGQIVAYTEMEKTGLRIKSPSGIFTFCKTESRDSLPLKYSDGSTVYSLVTGKESDPTTLAAGVSKINTKLNMNGNIVDLYMAEK